jgi:hypothetical protein
VDVTFVKAARSGEHHRVYLGSAGDSERVPVHVAHDLPHLVVESLFGIDDGLWAELAAGSHPETRRAATARDPRRQRLGRIVSGAATNAATGEWLSSGHRRAKTVTNCVANRFGDGPDTADGVRARARRSGDHGAQQLLDRLDDGTIELAIDEVRAVGRRWTALPPGDALRLRWPLRSDPPPRG